MSMTAIMTMKNTTRIIAAAVWATALAGCGGEDTGQKTYFSNFQPASVQLSQTAAGADAFTAPQGNTAMAAGHLWVADTGADTLYYSDDLTVSDGMNLNAIDSIQYNNGSSDYPLSGAQSPAFYEERLALALSGSHALVIFDQTPEAGGDNRGIILGAGGFSSAPAAECSARGFNNPQSVTFGGDKMIVADTDNNRVLIWNSVPQASATAPDYVLGQNGFTYCSAYDEDQDGAQDYQPANRTLNHPTAVWSDGDKLLVLDSGNNRVLVWNQFPDENFMYADQVLGQPDFVTAYANDGAHDASEDDPASTTLSGAVSGLDSNGKQILVADSGNNRVLMWNNWPQENGAGADIVLGQSSFKHIFANDDEQHCADEYASICGSSNRETLRTLNHPTGVALQGDYLVVTDSGNQRVLLFSGNANNPLEEE